MSAKPETLYLVDSHALLYQLFHAVAPMSSPNGLPTNAVFGMVRDHLFLRDKKPARLVYVFDAPGPTFRDDIVPDYKAHRAPMPDDLRLQIPMAQQVLRAFHVPVLSIPGVEADDVIATLAREGERRGMDVVICTSDKDCRQLLSERVRMFSLRKREFFDREALLKDWGIAPEQVIDYQTLVGDSVDNVKGVEGIGPKTATLYLQKYGTLDNLYEHRAELPDKKRESLERAYEQLPIGRQLVTLKTDVPLDVDWEAWRLHAFDGPKLLEIFREWGFRRFEDEIRAATSTAALGATSLHAPAPPKPSAPLTQIARAAPRGDDLFAHLDDDEPAETAPGGWQHDYRLVADPASFASFVHALRGQKRFAFDFETTALDPFAAQIVGAAFCWKPGESHYVAVRGPKGTTPLGDDAFLSALRPIFEDASVQKVNQNIKFDRQVLRAHGVCLRGVAGDSMIADYLLHAGERSHGMDVLSEKYLNHRPIPISELIGKGRGQRSMDTVPLEQIRDYACEDADVAFRLCETLEPLLEKEGLKRNGAYSLYGDLEIPLIDVLAEMEWAGIRLDLPILARMSEAMASDLVRLEGEIHALAGRPFNIAAVKQLREILYGELGFRPRRKTAITGAASTDQETLEDLAAQGHDLPKKLLEQRKIAKLKSTYVDALPALVNPKTGRVHTSFGQTVAATGRLSSSDPNLQNIPIRSELGGQIRQAFLPEPGWSLVSADYSQIELRLLAHFAGDETLLEAFATDEDIHARVAAQLFNVALDAVTSDQRRVAKTVNFGVIYGISAFGLAERLEISKEAAAEFIDTFFRTHPKVLEYQDRLLADCRQRGYVATILGRRRAISGIRGRTNYKSRNQPEREAINMEIQGSAADLIKVAMLAVDRRLRREGRRTRLLLQIHDELVFESPPEEIDAAVALVREEMTAALADRVRVRLSVDVGVGPNWLDVK